MTSHEFRGGPRPRGPLATSFAEALDPAQLADRLGYESEPWQLELLRSAAPRLLVNAARQVGKSTFTSILAVWTAIYRPGSLVLIISPSQRQSDETLAKVRAIYKAVGGPPDLEGENASSIRLENGSRVLSLPGSEQTTRGFSAVELMVCDEAARLDDETFTAALPMLAPGGRLIALSTPAGARGWWAEAWSDGGDHWRRIRIPADESRQYPPERIAAIKTAIGSWAFRAEYACEFSASAEAYFDLDSVMRAFKREVEPLFGVAA